MSVITKTITVSSNGENDMIDITRQTDEAIKASRLQDGIVVIFVSGSTAAVTTIEYEPGLKKDFPQMLARIAPSEIVYEHDNTWHDGNGHSHVRASLLGPSLTVPFKNKGLMLGTWQQIVLLEMDTRPREPQDNTAADWRIMVITVVQYHDSSKRDFANSLNAISDIGIGQSRGETKSRILC
jgi:secondary thiamine-phosphate synthase enzyme